MLQKFFDESANLLPGSRPLWWTAFGIGAWATLAASLGKPIAVIGAAAPVFLTALLFWILLTPGRWVPVFFIFLLLLPPLPVPMGNTGLHLAPAVALLRL